MNKYNNHKIHTEQGTFDSKGEYNRWLYLQSEAQKGHIFDLQRQIKFELIPNTSKYRKVSYIADFVYKDAEGNEHIEDYKGMETDVFKLKRKLFYYRYGKDIEIIK